MIFSTTLLWNLSWLGGLSPKNLMPPSSSPWPASGSQVLRITEPTFPQNQNVLTLIVKGQFESAQSLYETGLDYHQTDQFLEAIEAYEQAITADPTLDVAYINLSLIYIQLEQFDLAKVTLEDVLLLPDRDEAPASIHTLAHYNLAIIYNREENFETAIEHCSQALAITPEFSFAQELLNQLIELTK